MAVPILVKAPMTIQDRREMRCNSTRPLTQYGRHITRGAQAVEPEADVFDLDIKARSVEIRCLQDVRRALEVGDARARLPP